MRSARATRLAQGILVTATFSAALNLAVPVASDAALYDCSQPISNGIRPAATDCLFILRVVVGTEICDPACVCAPKGTVPSSATDALICLRAAVGQPAALNCPCPAGTTTTTVTSTSSSSSSTTTTTTVAPTDELLGALAQTNGRFNYNLTLGLPGADAACNTNFPGAHACTYQELLVAAAGGDLVGLKATNNSTVTSFWVIDSGLPAERQCIDDTVGGSFANWEYATAHTGTFGQKVNLDNAAGTLGAPFGGPGAGGANCTGSSWVGCCR